MGIEESHHEGLEEHEGVRVGNRSFCRDGCRLRAAFKVNVLRLKEELKRYVLIGRNLRVLRLFVVTHPFLGRKWLIDLCSLCYLCLLRQRWIYVGSVVKSRPLLCR